MANTQELKQVLSRKQAIVQGDEARVSKQHAAGKLTARERIVRFLDQGSFVELDALVSRDGDYAGVVTGYGTVQERPVYLFAQDFTVHGGAMGELQAKKICKVLDLALKTGAPVIAMCDSAGVRIDEGAAAMNAYSSIFASMARLSGVCPILALVLGPVVGGAAMIAQLADISIEAGDVGQLMVYGPTVVSALTGETVDAKALGGVENMSKQGGVSIPCANEQEALALAAALLDLLPGCNTEDAPLVDSDDMNRPFGDIDPDDGHSLLSAMADRGSYIELNAAWGSELRTALCRVGGQTVGLIASDAGVDGGELTPAGCAKTARFIRFCDCFSIPLVSMINSRGVKVPGAHNQSWTMITTSQLLYAYAEATTPKVSIIVGNAIGQAYIAMGGKANADVTYAWPGAVISALTPEAAVQVLYTDELRKSEKAPMQARAELEKNYADHVADGVAAAMRGTIDDVIDPAQTRQYVIASLEMLSSKRDNNPPKKHGNMPL